MADLDIAEIEKLLLKLDETLVGDTDYIVHLEVVDLGSWIIKFRKYGIIVNNAEIVCVGCMDIDANISFKSNSYFWQVINGGYDFNDEVVKNNIRQSGSAVALDLFRRMCIKPFNSQSNINMNASIPVRVGRAVSADGQQPLKAGFLLKKRDILAGWRCRYFVVYPGKLEYYIDQHDIHSRACISLTGAEVQPAKRMSVNGVGEHWGLLLKTRNPDKTFRLASELTGMEGMVEASTWEQVFTIATKLTVEPSVNNMSPRAAVAGKSRKSLINSKPTAEQAALMQSSFIGTAKRDAGPDEAAVAAADMTRRKLLIACGAVIVLLLACVCYLAFFASVANKPLFIGMAVALIGLLLWVAMTRLVKGKNGDGENIAPVSTAPVLSVAPTVPPPPPAGSAPSNGRTTPTTTGASSKGAQTPQSQQKKTVAVSPMASPPGVTNKKQN